jgi:replication initiation protein RepC
MNAATRHSGLPNGVSRFDLFNAFERVAIAHFRLSRTDVALIQHYVKRTYDQDYQPGKICAVWPMVCSTAEALYLSSRSINEAERRLERLGFLRRDIPENGARSGQRQDGYIIWASGINLGPLIERYDELIAAAEVLALRQSSINTCKAEIRRLNLAIRSSGNAQQKIRSGEILPGGRTARITSLEQLEAIKSTLGTILKELESKRGARNPSGSSETDGAPIIQANKNHEFCSVQTALPARELRITPRLAIQLATPEFHDTLALFGEPNWHNVIEASSVVATTIGISRGAWKGACHLLGRELAAVCVIIIHRNAALPKQHPYHAKNPGGCLVGMTKKLPQRANLTGMIRAIQGEQTDA